MGAVSSDEVVNLLLGDLLNAVKTLGNVVRGQQLLVCRLEQAITVGNVLDILVSNINVVEVRDGIAAELDDSDFLCKSMDEVVVCT